MSITGDPEGEPTKAGVALVDVLTGKDATIGILAALRERERSGRGQRIEVNLLSSLLGSLANQASAYLTTGTAPGRLGNRHPSIAPYETLRCADGMLAVACGNDGAVRPAVRCPRTPRRWRTDPRFATNPARVRHRVELVEALQRELARKDVAVWAELLTACRRRRGCGQRRWRRLRPGPTTRPVPDRERRGRPPGAGPPPDHLVAQPPAHPYAAAAPSASTRQRSAPDWRTPHEHHLRPAGLRPARPRRASTTCSADDERAVRASVRRLCDDRVEPHVARLVRGGPDRGPARPDEAVRRPRPARHAPRGLRLRRACRPSTTASPASSSRPCDSGIRSLVSVQGSLAMFAIWRWGTRGAEAGVAAPDGGRRARSAASGSPSPTTARTPAAMRTRARRDGRRLGPRRPQDVDHQRLASPTSPWSGPRPTRASAASSSRPTPRASPPRRSSTRCRCAPR